MKFKNKLFFSILSPAIVAPLAVVSCSQGSQENNNEFLSEASGILDYNNVYNISFEHDVENNQNIAKSTIKDLEEIINSIIKDDKEIQKLMQLYCFNMLYQAIKNPYDREGKRIPILSQNLTNYGQFLIDKTNPDDSKSDDKTFKNLDDFINSFTNIKINILAFKKDEQGNIVFNENDQLYKYLNSKDSSNQLNFQIEFKINNNKANEDIVDVQNNQIFYQTNKLRNEKKIINKYRNNPNQEIANIIQNQYTYQGTKMYYDKETKKFKTIVLPSNSIKTNENVLTPNSGFINPADTSRISTYFDFKQINTSNEYEQYLVINLQSGNYFDTNITSNWTTYLKQEKYLVDSKMKRITFKLNKKVTYEKEKTEQDN